jgi:N-acetylneuraminic acid mutarotase
MIEKRLFLAADFAVRVNFAPIDAPDPDGYKLDYGAAYSRRGNGLTYGWSSDKRGDTSHRESKYDNARGDSHIAVGHSDSWSINVPNGWYQVRALSGDPSTLDGDYRFNVEATPLLKGKPYPGFPFIEGITTVRVTDGKVTVTSDARAKNNRLNSLSILAVDAPVAPPRGVNIDWSRDNTVASPVARVEAAIVRMGDLVVVMGGFTNEYLGATRRVDVLNTKTNQWTRWADLPEAQTHIAAATDGRYIYIAGGQIGPLLSPNLTDKVWRFDPKTNQWEAFGQLPTIRAGAQMQFIDGKLHLVGGDDETRVVSQSTHYVLDLANPSAGWTEAAPLPVATDHHTTIVVDGDLYVLGGEIDHGTSYFTRSDFFRYDAATDTWATLPSMPTGLSHQEAATLTDGRRIIVIAGQADVQQMSNKVYSYDLATGVWEEHTGLPNARKGGIAWLDGDTIHYFAGDDEKFGQPTWSYKGVIES